MTNEYIVPTGLLEQSMNPTSRPTVRQRIVIDVDSGTVQHQETEAVEITVHMTPARAKKIEANQQKLQEMVKSVLLDFEKI
jgi:hypothetical protein